MLHINALKLEINTTNGLYGTVVNFADGLNIVRANNTSGKSTIFQSILYALGFEELIGAKNEKTMQSVLKDSVVDEKFTYPVLQSNIQLEIFNGSKTVTIKRSVKNETRKQQLIDVVEAAVISKGEQGEVRQMYVHDSGAASDGEFGFHLYLEEFLGWSLPNVIDTFGNKTKLYMPLIAPTFILEQKTGWSSFFATIPYYGVKSAEERVIEFLLNLDVFQNEQAKIALSIDKRVLQEKWDLMFENFQALALRGNAEVVGLESFPTIVNELSSVYFRIYRSGKYHSVTELIEQLTGEYDEIDAQTQKTVGENLQNNQIRLSSLNESLLSINLRQQQLGSELFYEREKYKQNVGQIKSVGEDLENNQSALKMLKLGADLPAKIAEQICPTCGQNTPDSLLPQGVDQVPMKIDENIKFLSSQLKMLNTFVKNQRSKISIKERQYHDYDERMTQIRQDIRSLKRDLVSDERLPSEELLERKINTRRNINFYADFLDRVDELKKRLKTLSDEFEKIKVRETNLSGDFLTHLDRKKLDAFQTTFLNLLGRFNYQSKDRSAIKISLDKYLPVIEVTLANGKQKSYDLRFDSSGSDHIRTMWAYYLSLMLTSKQNKGNHPNLLMLDEPQQQSASTADFRSFLKELSEHGDSQTLVFASFQDSQEDFEEATQGLKFTSIFSIGRFVKKID